MTKQNLIIAVFLFFQIARAQTLYWAYKIGSSYADLAYDISKDKFDNIYLAGGFSDSVNFNPNGLPVMATANGGFSDNFFAKYDRNFNLKWVIPIGTSDLEIGSNISTDTSLNVFVLGQASGSVDLDPSTNTFILNCSSSRGFIAKYDSLGAFINAHTIPVPYFSCSQTSKTTCNCELFKNGKFIHKGNGMTFVIQRQDSIQTETDPNRGYSSKFRIKWVDKCNYEGLVLESTFPFSDSIQKGRKTIPIKVQIISTGEDYYVFKAHRDNSPSLTDTIWVDKEN